MKITRKYTVLAAYIVVLASLVSATDYLAALDADDSEEIPVSDLHVFSSTTANAADPSAFTPSNFNGGNDHEQYEIHNRRKRDVLRRKTHEMHGAIPHYSMPSVYPSRPMPTEYHIRHAHVSAQTAVSAYRPARPTIKPIPHETKLSEYHASRPTLKPVKYETKAVEYPHRHKKHDHRPSKYKFDRLENLAEPKQYKSPGT